ncbi:patatin-like phospholipase family protein [Umboniibacter marinipuniceus]|uniref:NTE family protein n=1 Tax=Umboniibacter marinipuniceus TaxID=569599 RepID=A0A3M0AEK9_9GAMM|nr:patatin-like phospholipase family protein [Umboniibacter marinipuniceus]RMA77622.1 NTE family protein [Umboniibacter marinipuniceus]
MKTLNSHLSWLLPFILILLVPPKALADCPPAEERLCIGVVLGGGGARGGAHVGVLKVLEEEGIPVDVIAGTSVGSFIGGLYAMGKTPDEIEEILRSTAWEEGLNDSVEREDMPFRRKRQSDAFPINPELGFDGTEFKFPKGVAQGQRMGELIQRSVGSLPDLESFDDLLITYRAVAADIETGEAVVIDNGALFSAMQASMSIPGVVRPFEYNGRLLVDGGIANNLPVDVVRELGADIIIAVDIGTALPTRDQLTSSVAVLNQLVDFLIKDNVEYQKSLLGEQDILLTPRNDDVNMLDFDAFSNSIQIGYDEANKRRALITQIDVPTSAWERFSSRRNAIAEPELRVVAVNIENHSRLRDSIIVERLGFEVGDQFDQTTVQEGIDRTYALDVFERIDYHVEDTAEGQVLNIAATEKSWGPGYLDFQFQMQDDYKGSSEFSLGAAWTMTNINDLGAEWRTVVVGGTDKLIATDLYFPLEWAPLNHYISTGVIYKRDQLYIDTGNNLLANSIQSEVTTFLGQGWNFSNKSRVEVGALYSDGYVALPDIGDPVFNGGRVQYNSRGLYAEYFYDSLDNADFARRGRIFHVRFEDRKDSIDGDRGTPQTLETTWLEVYSIGDHTFSGQVRAESFRSDEVDVTVRQFELGGFLNLSGLPPSSLSGNHLRYANIVYKYRLLENDFGLFKSPIYLGASYEMGNVWDKRDQIDHQSLIESGSVFTGIDSPLGPIYLAYAKAEGGFDSFYFYLGSHY